MASGRVGIAATVGNEGAYGSGANIAGVQERQG